MQKIHKKMCCILIAIIVVLAAILPMVLMQGSDKDPPPAATVITESYSVSASETLSMKTVYSGLNLYDIQSPFDANYLPTASVNYNAVEGNFFVNFGSGAKQRQRGQFIDTSPNADYRLSFDIISEQTGFGVIIRAKNNSSSWANAVFENVYENGLTEKHCELEFNSGENTNLAIFFYSLNNETTESVEISNIFFERAVTLPEDPIKEGHTFIGWFLDEDCTIPYDFREITEDLTLYAGFQILTFTVNFNSMGGEPVSEMVADWNTVIELPELNRDGYNFLGWYTEDGILYEPAGIKNDTSLTAKWAIKRYVITFIVDGNEYITLEVDHGTKIDELKTRTELEGYSFVGIGGQIFAENEIITEDGIFTAFKDVAEQPNFFTDAWEFIKNNAAWFISGAVVSVALIITSIIFIIKKRGVKYGKIRK